MAKRSGLEAGYDERQVSVLGRAYRYAYLTLLFSLFFYIGSEAIFGRWCDAGAGVGICICISVAVLVVTCIWNDAYMNLNQKPWSVHLLFGVLALCNFGIAENNQRIGVLFADGKLGFGAVNLVFAVMFVVFEIVFL